MSPLVWDLLGGGGGGGWVGGGGGVCSKAKDKKFLRIYWMYMVIKEHDLFYGDQNLFKNNYFINGYQY